MWLLLDRLQSVNCTTGVDTLRLNGLRIAAMIDWLLTRLAASHASCAVCWQMLFWCCYSTVCLTAGFTTVFVPVQSGTNLELSKICSACFV